MAQVMIPLRMSEQSSSCSEDILAEVARFEHGGRILNDHYTSIEYAQRRLGHISRHPDYRNALNIHIKVRRESDEVFGRHGPQKLSVQIVRERELTCQIEPLTPYPTINNTQTIDDYASYGPTEWTPGMPDRWQEFGRPSSPTVSSQSCAVSQHDSVSERQDRIDGFHQRIYSAGTSQDDVQLKDGPESHNVVSTIASATEHAHSSYPEPLRTSFVQIDKSSIPYATLEHPGGGHVSTLGFTTASSLCNRPLQSHVKSCRRSQGLSANTVPASDGAHAMIRKVDRPSGIMKRSNRGTRHERAVKKDMKLVLAQSKAPVGSDLSRPTTEKRVTFSIARADSPLEGGDLPKVTTSVPFQPPTKERAAPSVYDERRRLRNLEKALQWTQGRSTPESEGTTQALTINSPNLVQQSDAEHVEKQTVHTDIPVPVGHAMLEEQRSHLHPPKEVTASNNDSKATNRETYLDAIATGARLPRTPNDAIAASHRRHEQLLSQYTDQKRRNTPRLRSSSEMPPRYPDMLPEFFSPANFQVRDLKPTGPVRCACGATTDDSSRFPAAADGIIWIQCETPSCKVWQHVDCMGTAVPWVIPSVLHSRSTRQATREAADAHSADDNDASLASARQLNPEVKYFCHVCNPWVHRQLLAQMRKARPILSENAIVV